MQRPPSVNFRDVLYDVILKQQWFRDFRLREGAKPLEFVAKFDSQNESKSVANDIRRSIKLNPDTRREAPSAAELLRFIAAEIEELGVLVMRSGVVGSNNKRKLSISEFSGFAGSDEIAPVIFINVNESSTAQLFTCVHELVHIWLV